MAVITGETCSPHGVTYGCDATSECDSFEHLMEDNNDEQGDEVAVSSDNHGDTDHCQRSVNVHIR